MRKSALAVVLAAVFTFSSAFADTMQPNTFYNPTHELDKDFNAAFNGHWQGTTGRSMNVRPPHGGSGKQAIAVRNGQLAEQFLALHVDLRGAPCR